MKNIQFNPISTGYVRKFKASDLTVLKEGAEDKEYVWDDDHRVVTVTNAVATAILERHGDQFTEVPYSNDDAPALDDSATVLEPSGERAGRVERVNDPIND